MSTKLDAALKGKFVNVNGEKEKIVKLDRASGSYVLESGMHVPGDDLTKKGRGLFYVPPRKQRKTAAAAKPAAKPARRAQSESTEAAVIDRELKGKFITLNPGTRAEDKQKIVAIVKDVGYKTEDGTVVPAGDVFKKGRGVFANTKKKSAAKETPAKTSSGLKPKAEVKKSIKPASGLKPKQQVKRRGERDEDETRVRVKRFTQDIAQQIEDGCADAISEALANGTLASLDVQVVALNVTFEDRGLLLEAAFVPGNAKEAEVAAFTEELFGENNDGGADEELDDEELDDEELDEEEESEEEDEDLDEEEEDEDLDEEDDESEEEEDEDLDEEEEDEDLDEEEEDEDLDEEDDEESEEDDEESEEDDEEDFDDEEEELDEEEEDEELEEEDEESEEDEVDFDAIAEEIGADAEKVAKYGQLYIDADFDAGVTVGNKVRDTRTKAVYHFIGSNSETADDAKVVIAKKGGKLVLVSLDAFAKYFAEV